MEVRGAGSDTASCASGTSAHSSGTQPAPNAERIGRRSASTASSAKVMARVLSRSRASSSALIVDVLDQATQFGDIVGIELAVARKMRHQRRDTAIEQALDQAAAFFQYIGLARQQRAVAVTAAFGVGGQRALFQQPVE